MSDKPAQASVETPVAKASEPKTSTIDTLFDTQPKTEPKERSSTAFALVAKEQAKIKAEREALARERESHKATLSEYEKFKAIEKKLKDDPMGAIKDLGFDDYAKLLEIQKRKNDEAKDPNIAKYRQLEEKLAAIEAEKIKDKQEADRIKNENIVAASRKTYDDNIKKEMSSDADKYAVINAFDLKDAVFAKMQETYRNTVKFDSKGQPHSWKELTPTEACEQLESELRDSISSLPLSVLKLLTEKLQTQTTQPQSKQEKVKEVKVEDDKPTKPLTKEQLKRKESSEAYQRALAKVMAAN